jgi:hypothetical protein
MIEMDHFLECARTGMRPRTTERVRPAGRTSPGEPSSGRVATETVWNEFAGTATRAPRPSHGNGDGNGFGGPRHRAAMPAQFIASRGDQT